MVRDMSVEIARLKKERNAVILAHNYQPPEVQDAADYVGDSLGLSIRAAESDADVIVFCGVRFMAETAKILAPGKMVLLPEPGAECPLAGMINVSGLKKLKARNPGVPVVSYVNTSAAVKAESDVCCTSSNLIKVVNSLDSDRVIFTPDRHLADYLRTKVSKEVIPWEGYCPTHVKILPQHIKEQKRMHPKAKVLAHPECRLDVIALADEVLSTGGMVSHVKSSPSREFIIATETGLLHTLMKGSPGKKFYPATELAVCPNMKRTDIHKVLGSLRDMRHVIEIKEGVIARAKKALDRMLELA